MYTLFWTKLLLIYIFYCYIYRLPGPTLHSGSITSIPTPFAQRFHQLQNTPAVNSEYAYTYLPRLMCICIGRGNFYSILLSYSTLVLTNYHVSYTHDIYKYNMHRQVLSNTLPMF